MSQTTNPYTIQANRGLPGLLADGGHDVFLRSRAPEGANLAFGLGVEAGTDPETQVVAYAGNAFGGVTSKTHALQRETEELGLDGAVIGETVSILRKGRVWVQTNEAVAPGDPVFCVNTGADAGQFRNDNTNATAVASAEFVSYEAESGLALLELNLP